MNKRPGCFQLSFFPNPQTASSPLAFKVIPIYLVLLELAIFTVVEGCGGGRVVIHRILSVHLTLLVSRRHHHPGRERVGSLSDGPVQQDDDQDQEGGVVAVLRTVFTVRWVQTFVLFEQVSPTTSRLPRGWGWWVFLAFFCCINFTRNLGSEEKRNYQNLAFTFSVILLSTGFNFESRI